MSLYPGKEVLYNGRSWWIGTMGRDGFWIERPGASVWIWNYDAGKLHPVE